MFNPLFENALLRDFVTVSSSVDTVNKGMLHFRANLNIKHSNLTCKQEGKILFIILISECLCMSHLWSKSNEHHSLCEF